MEMIIYLGKFDHDLTATEPETWFMVGKSSPNGPTIQVSEIINLPRSIAMKNH